MIAPTPTPDEPSRDLNRRLLVVVLIPNPLARPILPSWVEPGSLPALTTDDIAAWCRIEGPRVMRAFRN